METVTWDGEGWHVQLRDDGDNDLMVRIATSPDIDGEDAVWIPLREFRRLWPEIDRAEELLIDDPDPAAPSEVRPSDD